MERANREGYEAVGVPVRVNLKDRKTELNAEECKFRSAFRKPQTRSGTRIPCEICVTLTSLEPNDPFTGRCVVVLVNPQGCTARFHSPIKIGAVVQLEGLPSKNNITAHVVNCISLGEYEKSWLLGLSLIEPGNVWGIQAPPEDWML